jgi:hypothetical protein
MGPLAAIGIGTGAASMLSPFLSGGGPDYAKLSAMLQRLYGPQALGRDTRQLYGMNLGSPGFQNQLGQINLAGNQFSQNFNSALGRQGMGGDSARSGVGTVGQAGAPQMSSLHRGQAFGDLWNQSQNMALQNLMGRLGALGGLSSGPSSQDMFRSIFGSGIGAAGQYLGLAAGAPKQQKVGS